MLITALTWLIFIPAAYGLWLVLSEDAPERVGQRELDEANDLAVRHDSNRRYSSRMHRERDAYDWRIRYLGAKHLNYIRKFRSLWDGEVA